MRDVRGRLALAGLLLAGACSSGERPPAIPEGTWGGDDAGLLLSGTSAHVHVGCTQGDFEAPIPVGGDGSFTAEGRYSHRHELFPIATGESHPATLTGVLDGNDRLTFTVRVADGEVQYGPALVRRGVEPAMQDCPICRFPEAEPDLSATLSGGPVVQLVRTAGS